MSVLKRKFYSQNTIDVARNLLGCVLCRRIEDKIYRGKIVETEAYIQEDPACHAFRGKTSRNEVMFGNPGFLYVYFTYGMHFCANAVTEKGGRGCAVLIRALEPLSEDFDNTNGPARLCKSLNITKDLNGVDLTSSKSPIWIEEGIKPDEIVTTVRVGIKQAADYPWRFYIKDNRWVSKKS